MGKSNKGFTLAELLVVIAILAIISVTAYTNFSGSTDKAKNSTKLNQLASIEGALNMYYQDNNYYPMPSVYSATNNVWGYNNTAVASVNNTLTLTMDGNKIATLTAGAGGGIVYNTGSTPTTQIGAKGVVDETVLGKQYLSQTVMDPSLKDRTVGNDKALADYGVGKYVYAVYAKSDFTAASKKGKAYNLAATLSDEQKWYVTKLSGNFDSSTCVNCPNSLIGSGTVNLNDRESSTTGTYTNANERIPYPIDGF